MKTTTVIWNPGAGSAEQAFELRTQLRQKHDVEFHETTTKEEAFSIARATDANVLVAAGGDGTINSVINGLAHNDTDVTLSVLPLGTGNNLCRSLGIPLDPSLAMRTVFGTDVRRIDLVKVRAGDTESRFANTASGGNADRVIDSLAADVKECWGPWCYLRSALPIVTDLQAYDVDIVLDNDTGERFTVWNVIIANGKTAAGGLPVAPRASLEDGLLDVIIVKDGSPLDTAALAAEFFLGDYLQDERVVYRRARQVRINVHADLRFLVDGEMLSGNPIEFTVLPHALPVVVGPDYDSSSEC